MFRVDAKSFCDTRNPGRPAYIAKFKVLCGLQEHDLRAILFKSLETAALAKAS